MTDLVFFVLGGCVVGAAIFYAGHRTATNAFFSRAKGDPSTVEQEIIAAYRKATGKAPATPASTTAGASPPSA